MLQQENTNLYLINQSWVKTDSIKTVQLNNQNQLIAQQTQDIARLKKNVNTAITVGGLTVGISIGLLCLLLK